MTGYENEFHLMLVTASVTTGAKLLHPAIGYQGTRPVRAARRGGVVTDAGEPRSGPIALSGNSAKTCENPKIHKIQWFIITPLKIFSK